MLNMNANADRERRRISMAELDALKFQEGQRKESVAGLNAMPGQVGPQRSGYHNEGDYRAGLARQSGIANLTSELSGKGGIDVAHSYGRSPALSALKQAAPVNLPEADTDNLSHYGRLAAVQGANTQNQRLREAAFAESTEDDPYYVGKRGDLARAEAIKNARATGEATVAKHEAEFPMREDLLRDERARARERGYYDPAVETAKVKGQADVARAGADRQRERSAAIKAFADLAKTASGIEPEIDTDELEPSKATGPYGAALRGLGLGTTRKRKPNPQYDTIQRAMEEARTAFGGGEEGGGAGGQELSQQDLQDFATEQGIKIEEARELARQYGYAIR
jgi:hypothetical protein